MRYALPFAIAVVLLPAGRSPACIWDSETLAQERQRFPNTLELLTGKFLRHSPAFYQWRLADRLEKLKTDPDNDRLLDDLAVSYEKLGRHADAIEVARGQLARNPDRYETLANLGTFLVHAGEYDEGLTLIDRALEVNPDAHFGREKYQRLLVLYLQSRMEDGKVTLPLAPPNFQVADQNGYDFPFVRFVAAKLGRTEGYLSREQLVDAVDGVQGMMRFSQHDHPVLLEVLGELLMASRIERIDAKQLAARCYLLASRQADDKQSSARYRELAKIAISTQIQPGSGQKEVTLDEVETQLDAELADAKNWFDEVAEQEKAWIEADADVEEEFRRAYHVEPVALETDPEFNPSIRDEANGPLPLAILCVLIAALFVFSVLFCRNMFSRRSSISQPSSGEQER